MSFPFVCLASLISNMNPDLKWSLCRVRFLPLVRVWPDFAQLHFRDQILCKLWCFRLVTWDTAINCRHQKYRVVMITVTIIAVNAAPQQLQTDFNDHRQLLEIKCTNVHLFLKSYCYYCSFRLKTQDCVQRFKTWRRMAAMRTVT